MLLVGLILVFLMAAVPCNGFGNPAVNLSAYRQGLCRADLLCIKDANANANAPGGPRVYDKTAAQLRPLPYLWGVHVE